MDLRLGDALARALEIDDPSRGGTRFLSQTKSYELELLKLFGSQVEGRAPAERAAADYYKEFDEADPRCALVQELGYLLGPQWLAPEVTRHLDSLLRSEIARASPGSAGHRSRSVPPTFSEPSSREAWCAVRDGLADLWDYWGEAVHLRSQARRKRGSKEHDWTRPLAVEDAEASRFRARDDIHPPPDPVITLDAHLGEAFCTLAVLVHSHLSDASVVAQESEGTSSSPVHTARWKSWTTSPHSAIDITSPSKISVSLTTSSSTWSSRRIVTRTAAPPTMTSARSG